MTAYSTGGLISGENRSVLIGRVAAETIGGMYADVAFFSALSVGCLLYTSGLKYVAAGLSGVLFISLCAGCAAKEGKDEGAVSYVGIDVNPSVSLMLDKNNKVVSVIAENEDAQVLLYGCLLYTSRAAGSVGIIRKGTIALTGRSMAFV